MWNHKWKQERQPVLLVHFCFSSHFFLPTSPLWTLKNSQGSVAVFRIKEDAIPSFFPKLLSRSGSFNSNANARMATQNEDSKANDSVYILLSCIIGDRNCYPSATTSQTGQMFFCNAHSSNTTRMSLPECHSGSVGKLSMNPLWIMFEPISVRPKLYSNCWAHVRPHLAPPSPQVPKLTEEYF